MHAQSALFALFALIRKDLLLFVADRRALLLTLMMPIVLGAFFGFLFGGSGSSKTGTIDIGLVQLDHSDTSLKIAASLKADSNLKVVELSQDEARLRVKKGKLSAAIIFPNGFGEAASAAFFGTRDKPALPILYDPSQATVLAMVKGILTQYVMQHVSSGALNGPSGLKIIDDSLQKLENETAPDKVELRQFLASVKQYQQKVQAHGEANPGAVPQSGLAMPFTTTDSALSSGPKYNGYGHSFAGMSVQFILFMGVDAGIAMLLIRRLGIWNRILAAPIDLSTVLLARILSTTILAFFLLCFVFMFAILVFGVDLAGSKPGFVGIALCFSLMTATFGLFIAAFGKTPEAARGIAVFATLMLVMLGGAWVPSFIFPQWLQTVTLIVPTRWAVDGLDAMTWRGLGFEVALPAMAVLLGFTLLFGGLAIWKFKRELQ
jgi:ABC-2 type transport system permease protein